MNSVFADTSFYVALLNRRDVAHGRAVELSRQFQSDVVTSEYILLEVANWFAQSIRRSAFRSFLEQLNGGLGIVIVESGHALFESGIQLYLARADKNWSLTDCISMVILEERRLTQVLTTDHHFEQAGYEVLMKWQT